MTNSINPSHYKSDTIADKYPKYYKDVSGVDAIDVYSVHALFGIDDPSGAIQHASKKLLLSGVRTGGKSKADDIREARDTLTRWLEIQERLVKDLRDEKYGVAKYGFIERNLTEPPFPDSIPPHTINAADQGWIEWKGGFCPVMGSDWVEVDYGDGPEKGPAGSFDWQWYSNGGAGDITRYRVVK